MTKKKREKKIVEVKGIKCEVKNPRKKDVVLFYQENLQKEIDRYIAENRMMEKKRVYADKMKTNVVLAPFVLGWLKKPEDPDEYKVIKGYITIEELEEKRKKESEKGKKKSKRKRTKRKTNPSTSKSKKATTKKAASKKSSKKKN